MEDILVPIAFFACAAFIVWTLIQSNMKRAQMMHEERMLAIERGVAMPDMGTRKQKNPYKWPFILIGIGLAWAVAVMIRGGESYGWALLPLFIGSGLLIAHRYQTRDRKPRPEDTLPPGI